MLKAFKDRIMARSHGFMQQDDVAELVKIARLHPVLIRCGSGRFTTPAQDVTHFIDIINRDGADYVRDVSLLYEAPESNMARHLAHEAAIDEENDMSTARDDFEF